MARGTVQIDSQRCKGCGLCIAACPQHVLAFSPDLNAQGYHPITLIEPMGRLAALPVDGVRGCTGCALCALVCPDTVFQVYREIVHRGDRHARATGGAGAPVAAGQEISHEGALERE